MCRALRPLLDREKYVVNEKPVRSKRHHVENNLLGPLLLRPMVVQCRAGCHALRLRRQRTESVPPRDRWLSGRSPSCTQETRSIRIEGEALSANRHERFVSQLEQVTNATVTEEDHPLAGRAGRTALRRCLQDRAGHVAESVHAGKLPAFTTSRRALRTWRSSWTRSSSWMRRSRALRHWCTRRCGRSPRVLHPFVDGNGRLHRLLFHNVLRRRGLTPDQVILPVSAAIVSERSR